MKSNLIAVNKNYQKRKIHLEGKQNFDFYINTLIKMAGKECHAVARVSNNMNQKKKNQKAHIYVLKTKYNQLKHT